MSIASGVPPPGRGHLGIAMQTCPIVVPVEDRELTDTYAAGALRTRLLEHLAVGRCVTLDLSRAEAISPLYAAEVFTSLAQKLGRQWLVSRLRVIGAQDFMYRMIAEAICGRARTHQPEAEPIQPCAI
jgi:hypothetical protein